MQSATATKAVEINDIVRVQAETQRTIGQHPPTYLALIVDNDDEQPQYRLASYFSPNHVVWEENIVDVITSDDECNATEKNLLDLLLDAEARQEVIDRGDTVLPTSGSVAYHNGQPHLVRDHKHVEGQHGLTTMLVAETRGGETVEIPWFEIEDSTDACHRDHHDFSQRVDKALEDAQRAAKEEVCRPFRDEGLRLHARRAAMKKQQLCFELLSDPKMPKTLTIEGTVTGATEAGVTVRVDDTSHVIPLAAIDTVKPHDPMGDIPF